MIVWAAFILCASLIVYSGIRLSRYGDIIAEKTGLGRTWAGVVLMASVTSLPELVAGLGAVTIAESPDIAVGGVVGSCVFNMLILSMLDAMYRHMPLTSRAAEGNILSAGFGILLLSIVAAGLFLQDRVPALWWTGTYTLLIILVYFIAMKLLLSYERRRVAAFMKEHAEVVLRYRDITTASAFARYALNAVVVITAALFLPEIGGRIAETTGLGQTFVGNIFIAIATSLPEVVVSIAAIRMGVVDMATGNLLGSNVFNVFILAIDDIFYAEGPILSSADPNHMLPVIAAMAMTTVAVIGLIYRPGRKPLWLAWDSMGMVLIFMMNMLALFVLR